MSMNDCVGDGVSGGTRPPHPYPGLWSWVVLVMGLFKSILGLRSRPLPPPEERRRSRWRDLGVVVVVCPSEVVLSQVNPWTGGFMGTRMVSWDMVYWSGDVPPEEEYVSFLKKLKDRGAGLGVDYAAADSSFRLKYPALAEFMLSLTSPDGAGRQVSTLLIFAEDGDFKGLLNERQEGLQLWASSDSLDGLLETLEALLEAPETPWRVAGKRAGRDRRG